MRISYLSAFILLPGFLLAQPASFETKKLSGKETDNLVALGKMYGYIRHFSPHAGLDQLNWETFLIKKIPLVEPLGNNVELISRLDTIASELSEVIWVCNKNMCATRTNMHYRMMPRLKGKANSFMYQEQRGWGNRGVNISGTENGFSVKRVQFPLSASLPKNILRPDEFQRFTLIDEVELCLPLTVFANDKGSVAHPQQYPLYPLVKTPYSASNRLVRISSIIIAWNVIRHYYPHLKLMHIDWDKVLPEYIQRASSCRSEHEFFELLQEFAAAYRDGQAHVTALVPAEMRPIFTPPIHIDMADEKAIVTWCALADTSVLHDGAEVISIDHVPVKKWMSNVSKLVSGSTPDGINASASQQLLYGRKGSTIQIEVKTSDKKTTTVPVSRSIDAEKNRVSWRRPDVVNEMDGGIFYVDLSSIHDSTWKTSLPKLSKAAGIIFDMRGPMRATGLADSLPGYLISSPEPWPKFVTPVAYFPEQRNPVDYEEVLRKSMPLKPRLSDNVVFLVDGHVTGKMESLATFFSFNKTGSLIGTVTGGSQGTTNTFTLFGLYEIWFTGTEVLGQEGSLHHGIGIQPNVFIKKTAKGLSEGRDEQLEKAVEMLTN